MNTRIFNVKVSAVEERLAIQLVKSEQQWKWFLSRGTEGHSFSLVAAEPPYQASQQTNFRRVRDQPGFPASIPALFQIFVCMSVCITAFASIPSNRN